MRKRSTRVCSSWEVCDELLLLVGDLVVLGLELGQLLAQRRPPRQRLAGQVLVALLQRGLGLLLQLVGLLLQPLRLQLDPLAGRRHVGHAPAHLLVSCSSCFS